jgi:uncharacterized membrane protein YsdA (DUF1294 family)
MPFDLTIQNITIYLAAINIITFLAFWGDKRAAQNGLWRTPEKTLLLLTFLGGTPAAYLAIKKLRHKNRKSSFKLMMILAVIAQIITALYILTKNI